jgi:hypothetical protein
VRHLLAAGVACLLAGGCEPVAPPAKDHYDLDGSDVLIVGKAFLDQRGCPSCHGNDLAGSTTALPGTNAFPANLTPHPGTGIGNWADLQIARAIRYGIDDEGLALCPPMPHFAEGDGGGMTDLEVDAIIAYLRSLPAVEQMVPDSMCPPIKPAPPADLSVAPPADLSVALPDMAMPDLESEHD